MLSIEGLSYRSITEVPSGNLIYLLRATGPAVALLSNIPAGKRAQSRTRRRLFCTTPAENGACH
jgi:hypothetical protein